MLLLSPRRVTFGLETWEQVESVTIEREAEKVIEAWSDDGPHAVLVDVPEQRVTVKVVQALLGEDMDEPRPGAQAVLTFETAVNSSSAERRVVTLTGVVTAVSYGVSRKSGSARTVVLTAVSSNGSSDPVSVAAAS